MSAPEFPKHVMGCEAPYGGCPGGAACWGIAVEPHPDDLAAADADDHPDALIAATAEVARKAAEALSGYGHSIPRPASPEWVEAAAEAGMVRRADLIDGAYYVGCCRNAYMARWFAKAKHDPRARWSISYDGVEWHRSEVMPRRVAEAEAVGARVIDKVDSTGNASVVVHAGGCTTEGCPGLDAHDGCWSPEGGKGAFIHMRVKFGSVFTEVINHPEDDDGWDLFVPTLLVLSPVL